MKPSRNRLYGILAIACFAGYVWIYLNISGGMNDQSTGVNVCLIKHFTNISCPSCGSTRSVLSILKGEFIQALYFNPIGFLLLIILVITPLWIFNDFIKNKDTLLQVYIKTETILKKKSIAVPSIMLLVLNWGWNIYKDL